MLGLNSGLLGVQRVPTPGSASGLWVPNEQVISRRLRQWPFPEDPDFGSVSLLLPFDGANNSTNFSDVSLNTYSITATGDVKISTAQSQYGGSSCYFDGNSDFITAAAGASPSGSEDFTIEGWFYPTAASGRDFVLYETRGGSGFVFFINSNSRLQVFDSGAGLMSESTSGVTANSWNYIALVKSGSTNTYRIGNSSAGTFTLSSVATATTCRIGARNDGAAGYEGYIDMMRITKKARTITAAPTAAFPYP